MLAEIKKNMNQMQPILIKVVKKDILLMQLPDLVMVDMPDQDLLNQLRWLWQNNGVDLIKLKIAV